MVIRGTHIFKNEEAITNFRSWTEVGSILKTTKTGSHYTKFSRLGFLFPDGDSGKNIVIREREDVDRNEMPQDHVKSDTVLGFCHMWIS